MQFFLTMSALIDPHDDPIERCSTLCSEVYFELKQDVFAVSSKDSVTPHDQLERNDHKATVCHTYIILRYVEKDEKLEPLTLENFATSNLFSTFPSKVKLI